MKKNERNRQDKCKSIRKKKRQGFSGVRKYDLVTNANVDNEQKQEEGTSDVSSDQPCASTLSEIL